jgi:ribonuclease D
VENLLTPDYLRRVLWEPPVVPAGGDLREAVRAALASLGARPWQLDLVGDEVTAAIEAHPDR